jgi:hypothetical protein
MYKSCFAVYGSSGRLCFHVSAYKVSFNTGRLFPSPAYRRGIKEFTLK